jgi:FMN reductase
MGLKIVGLSGSLSQPSRTTVLVCEIAASISELTGQPAQVFELAAEAPFVFSALNRDQLHGRAAALITAVEQADLLVVGTPVYRASYTGALKHVFDLVHHTHFAGKPVAVCATGGTPLHGLMLEHEMRPLFGFLNALTLPTTVYALETDFTDYRISNAKTLARIARVAAEAADQLSLRATRTTERFEPPSIPGYPLNLQLETTS